VITYDDVVSLLANACPSYAASPERAAIDQADGDYLLVSGFVRHLVRLLERGEIESFRAVFGTVERILDEGEPAALDLMHLGFFEDLTDPDIYEGSALPADFALWLGPGARRDPSVRAMLENDRF
jgi:hypothetical protein